LIIVVSEFKTLFTVRNLGWVVDRNRTAEKVVRRRTSCTFDGMNPLGESCVEICDAQISLLFVGFLDRTAPPIRMNPILCEGPGRRPSPLARVLISYSGYLLSVNGSVVWTKVNPHARFFCVWKMLFTLSFEDRLFHLCKPSLFKLHIIIPKTDSIQILRRS